MGGGHPNDYYVILSKSTKAVDEKSGFEILEEVIRNENGDEQQSKELFLSSVQKLSLSGSIEVVEEEAPVLVEREQVSSVQEAELKSDGEWCRDDMPGNTPELSSTEYDLLEEEQEEQEEQEQKEQSKDQEEKGQKGQEDDQGQREFEKQEDLKTRQPPSSQQEEFELNAQPPLEMLQSMHKGLMNTTGENNCFLNGVLQILWHNKAFRRCLLSMQNHTCKDSKPEYCVYCNLKNLFLEYQFSDSAQIPPTALRKTLAFIFKPESRFQLNSMDDAAEVLEAILQRLHEDFLNDQRRLIQSHPTFSGRSGSLHSLQRKEVSICNPSCLAHSIFGINILEQSVCSCGATTEPMCYSAFVQYFSVKELLQMAQAMTKPLPEGWEKKITPTGQTYFVNHNSKKSSWTAPPGCDIGDSPGYSFSFLLHTVAINNLVTCPNDLCKRKNPTFRTLLNVPKVVSVGLTWLSASVGSGEVRELMKLVQPTINLLKMFNASAIQNEVSQVMELRGLVCFYGLHYVAFSFSSSFQTWLMFDDARVIEVGPSFEDVIHKCIKSCYQPSLLFYEAPE